MTNCTMCYKKLEADEVSTVGYARLCEHCYKSSVAINPSFGKSLKEIMEENK